MVAHQQVMQCIQECQQVAGQIRSLANQAPSPQVRDQLMESAHHVDMCIRECEFAAQRVQQAAGQPGYAPRWS